jgi:chemotaxis protein MotB
MAKKKRGAGHAGGHGWYVSFADLMGLMMSFFVMLVAFSNQDQQKLKIVAGSMREAFGVQTARYTGIIESADKAEAEERRAHSAGGGVQYADPR